MFKLSNDPTNYELLIHRIDALKLAGLPDELRAAREAMHDVYPLSERKYQGQKMLRNNSSNNLFFIV